MARALVNNPLFIIADEPTGSLDSKNGDMIMNLLQECQTTLKRTIILVTHNMEYLPLADKLLHIQDGRVEEQRDGSIKATTDELLSQMKERIDRLAKSKQPNSGVPRVKKIQ
jgi:ABC-type lipoprotein export system ATPase subunit